ncbi:MAG: recombinase RecT [Sulfitobacter sp.]|nr:recombinase RecT [Sulfitobacter sp.]
MTDAIQKQGPNAIAALINARATQLKELVGEEKFDQFKGNVLAQLRPVNAQGEPNKLPRCSPDTFYAAAHQAATLKLMPGPLQEVYMVPYGKTATLIIGFRGYMTLAMRHPDVVKISAKCLFKGQHFRYDAVTDAFEHEMKLDDDMSEENLIGAWCRVKLRNCDEPITLVMNRTQLDERRNKSAASQGNFWKNHPIAMYRKTVIRALLNSGEVPRSTELANAIAFEQAEERKAEILNVRTEPAGPVATEVEIGFGDDVHDDPDQDNFGLGEAEASPARKKKPKPKGDKHALLSDIGNEQGRLKLKDNQLLDVATDVCGTTVLDIEDLTAEQLTSVLKELASQ